MDNSKTKNVFILILLALNAFLLGLVLLDRAETAGAHRAAEEAAFRLLDENGITPSVEVRLGEPAPAVYSLTRSMDDEKRLFSSLLGAVRAEDLGGNIRFYASSSGQASARGTGEMDILLTPGDYTLGGDPARSAAMVVKKLGLSSDVSGATVESDGEATLVTLPLTWKGCRVYNASVQLTYGDGELVMMSGTRLFDVGSRQTAEAMDSLTAVVRFIESVRGGGYVCSELREVRCGYLLSVTVSGESTLTPVWEFVTDTVSVYINAVTGKAESVA